MKIIIVGGGISGLSTYLFLKKLLPHPPTPETSHEILIYESHKAETPQTATVGAGLGLGPNGMRQLKSLSPEIRDEIFNCGYPVRRFQVNNAYNWILGAFIGGDMERWGEKVVMLRRMDLWNCLKRRIDKGDLKEGKALVAIKNKEIEGMERLVAVFKNVDNAELEEVEADLIIGADGVRSVVRDYVVEEGKAQYEGFLGVGGFMSSSFLKPLPEQKILRYPLSPVVMTFGAQGFFGYGPCTSEAPSITAASTKNFNPNDADLLPNYGPVAMWWSTYDSPTIPDDYKAPDQSEVRQQLTERHGNWKDPVIAKIIAESSIDIMMPTFVTPKLPTWSKGMVILIGDAAHALPSTSGQGASQALEDAHALSLILAHYLQKAYSTPAHDDGGDIGESLSSLTEADATSLTARKYEALRKPRVEAILDRARKMQSDKRKKGFIEEHLVYLLMWLMCKFLPMSWLDEVFAYNVENEVVKLLKD